MFQKCFRGDSPKLL